MIGVTRETTNCDIFKVETGVRVVQMRISVDEVKCLPHIVTFRCGTKALVSVRGRPPLCLRWMRVSHVRRKCGTDTGARRLVTAPEPPTMTEAGAWRETAVKDPPRAVEEPGSAEEASPAASVPVPSPEVPSPVQGAASPAGSAVSSVQEDGNPASSDAEMAVPE